MFDIEKFKRNNIIFLSPLKLIGHIYKQEVFHNVDMVILYGVLYKEGIMYDVPSLYSTPYMKTEKPTTTIPIRAYLRASHKSLTPPTSFSLI
jgi:hypothetical protein